MRDLDRIYKENFIKVYRYVLSMSGDVHIAEDMTQETFIRAYHGIGSFKGDCSITTWLCRIARNTFINHGKRARHGADISEQLKKQTLHQESAEHEVMDQMAETRIMGLVNDLPEPYREVFSLRMFSELPYSEIERIFSKSDGWARVVFHRAKLMLKEELKDEYQV